LNNIRLNINRLAISKFKEKIKGEKMDLEKRCEEGTIGIGEFFEFAVCKRPVRTHALGKGVHTSNEGDYAVLPYVLRDDLLALEKVTKLNCPEKGDFTTAKGTTGPINGNIFIKIKKGKFPEYLLIEGDNLSRGSGSVYGLMQKYLGERKLKPDK
jgi:hypothetical protein